MTVNIAVRLISTVPSATEIGYCCVQNFYFSSGGVVQSLSSDLGAVARYHAGAVPAACFQYLLATNGIFVTFAVLLLPLTTTPTSVPALW